MKRLILLFCAILMPATAASASWLNALQGSEGQVAYAAEAAGTAIFVAGSTQGAVDFFPELTSAGGDDIFLAKMNDGGGFTWARGAGGPLNDVATGVAVDGAGNCYLTGFFSDTAQFGTTNVVTNGDFDVFVAKYSSAGALVWVQGFGGADLDFANDIAVDGSHNCYVTGEFADSMVVGGTTLTSNGSSDIFVVKCDSSGAVLWAKNAGGTSSDQGHGIEADAAGNLVVVGAFALTASFDGNDLVSDGIFDAFVVKYNTAGDFRWATQAGGTNLDRARAVALGSLGQVYVTGEFTGTADFGTSVKTSNGASDLFLWKVSSSGAFNWVRTAGGPGIDIGKGITVDGSGNIAITGDFHNSIDLGNGVAARGKSDVFVSQLSPAGAYLWSVAGGGTDGDHGEAITAGPSGDLYFAGDYRLVAHFHSGALGSVGANEAFIACYDPSDPTPVVGPTGVERTLHQNVPNPFSGSTRISYDVRDGAAVRLDVFDVAGRRVRTLLHGVPRGRAVTWDGHTDAGALAPSGVYFYRLTTPGQVDVRKLIIQR